MAPTTVRPLSSTQERRMLDYVETLFLDITRAYKKRSDPSSHLQTLSEYLIATHSLLIMILQIPPLDPSTSLRTTLLLRISGDVFSSIPGYAPEAVILRPLLAWLDDLDKGWQAVLKRQAWDTELDQGIDIDLALASSDVPISSTPVSQTERTRLRSLLISGSSSLEEWLEGMERGAGTFEEALEQLGVREGFEDLFHRTLGELGSLAAP